MAKPLDLSTALLGSSDTSIQTQHAKILFLVHAGLIVRDLGARSAGELKLRMRIVRSGRASQREVSVQHTVLPTATT